MQSNNPVSLTQNILLLLYNCIVECKCSCLIMFCNWPNKRRTESILIWRKYSELQTTSENSTFFFGTSIQWQLIKEDFQLNAELEKLRPRNCSQVLPLSHWVLISNLLVYQGPKQENACCTTMQGNVTSQERINI